MGNTPVIDLLFLEIGDKFWLDGIEFTLRSFYSDYHKIEKYFLDAKFPDDRERFSDEYDWCHVRHKSAVFYNRQEMVDVIRSGNYKIW